MRGFEAAMKCPQCQFDNPAGMKFCGQCGAKLGVSCSQCGAESPPGFKFCGECGASFSTTGLQAPPAQASPAPSGAKAPTVQSYTPPHLAERILRSRSALEGEKKQVTVLFCDLVSSTALADRLGPETMHLLLNRFFELALGEVHRYEGTINQFLGDGFMALFGAPVTHEDHARRAVLAALGLRRRLAEQGPELGRPYGVELAVRMGLNTGWVVVGGIGDHLRMDYTAVGDTTNLAARLQQKAEPHQILVSEATARLARGEALFEALPPFLVKGKEEPIQAFLLGGAEWSADKIVLESARSPFVGRQRECALLGELRDLAAQGHGQVVGLSGEPGSGKSRLLVEFRRASRSPGMLFWHGRCLSYGAGTPFLPLLDLLRKAWEIEPEDLPEDQTARIRDHLAALGLTEEEAVSCLLRLFGLDDGSPALLHLSPQALLQRTSAALRQVFMAASRERLLIVEIEDLHWSDPTSEDFLVFLLEGIAASRLLLLLTYRTGYAPRFLDKSYATQIPLRRLSADDSRALLAAALDPADVSPELTETIIAKAEGNPFFLEELSRSVAERPGRDQLAVPDTIHGVLLARIDRLPEEHKRLLQAASVLGREFSRDILYALWDPPASLRSLLEDLQRWEFLYEVGAAESPQVFFRHALTQEAVYQTLLTARRQQLHATAGTAFEVLYAERLPEAYDRLTYHFSAAALPAEAIHYLQLQAGKAARGYAHAEAVQALEAALVQVDGLPAETGARKRLELVLLLAESFLPLARLKETLDLLHRHLEAAERLADPALLGPFHFWLAHTYSYLGQAEETTTHAGQAIRLARAAADPATEGKAHYVLSRDAFWAGHFAQGLTHGTEAVALLGRGEEPWWKGQAYWVLGFHHFVLGHFEQAFAAMGETHAIWQALQDPRLDASWSLGYFYAALGEWDRGIEECRKGVERAQDPLNTAAGLGFLGYAWLEKGDLDQALAALAPSVEQLERAGMRQLLGWFSAYQAETLARTGDLARAEELARQAIALTRESGFPYGEAIARRAAGRVALLAQRPFAAESEWQQAAEIFTALGVPFEAARTGLERAALAKRQGREARAREHRAAAERLLAELRESPLAHDALDLAAAAGDALCRRLELPLKES